MGEAPPQANRTAGAANSARFVPALAPDVLQLIFTSKRGRFSNATVVPLDQRLRCQLVCKDWRAALDARTLAVPELHLFLEDRSARRCWTGPTACSRKWRRWCWWRFPAAPC